MFYSFFQNLTVSMSKESYFELCEALGTEPVEEEIPVEIEDFPLEVQEAINIYFKLRDEWDGMNGVYMGKSYAGLQDILDILEVQQGDRKTILDWISALDNARSRVLQAQKPKSATKATP